MGMPRSSEAFCQIRWAGNSTLKYTSTLFPMRNRREIDGVWSGDQPTLHATCQARERGHALGSSPVQPPSDLWPDHSLLSQSSQDQLGSQQPICRGRPKLNVWSGSMKWILRFHTDNKRIPTSNCKKTKQNTDYTGVRYLSLKLNTESEG